MNIVLTSVEPDLTDAWKRYCGDLECVAIRRGSIFDVSCDALVSPANSFGFMDGGIDMLYTQYFGLHLQERLQDVIQARHSGELLVGAAEIVETGHEDKPFLIAAPTMRVPMVLRESVNPYLAARAVLLLVKQGIFTHGTYAGEKISDYVETVAFPGLGTGVGRVSPDICAYQMRTAIEEVILGKFTFPVSWADAQHRHQQLFTDDTHDLQHDAF